MDLGAGEESATGVTGLESFRQGVRRVLQACGLCPTSLSSTPNPIPASGGVQFERKGRMLWSGMSAEGARTVPIHILTVPGGARVFSLLGALPYLT